MNAIEILSSHHLKRTSCREGIINVILTAGEALSESEIKERLEGNYDRTTFYRSFITLVDYKILHKIVVDNQLVKYAVEHTKEDEPEHAHFFCNECHKVVCMDDVPVLKYNLPEGYSDSETEVLIKGVCSSCKNKKKS